MIRLLMIVSGAFEVAFGASALLTPNMVVDALGRRAAYRRCFSFASSARRLWRLASPLCFARDAPATSGGLAMAYGLALYNVLAVALITWTASSGAGSASLWAAGLFHALIGALFVYALAVNEKSPG